MRRRQPDPIEVQQMRQEANQRKQEADMIRFLGFLRSFKFTLNSRQRVEKERKEREEAQIKQRNLEEEKAVCI